MINTFDYSAVDSYMNEQVKRESEKTRSETLKNDRSHAINQGIKWSIIALAAGIAIYIMLSGLGNAQSFKQIKENITRSQVDGISSAEGMVKSDYIGEDVILDVDSLLKETSEFPQQEEQQVSSVRNYVIFDYFQINQGNISTLIVGRSYPDPDSESDSQWCYANIKSNGAANLRFNFINVDEDGRDLNDIDEAALSVLGLTFEQALNVRSKCGI